MSAIFEAKDVSLEIGKRVNGGRRKIFDGLSFSVQRGESLGVLGRNGVGKSTLLRMVAGIIEPTSGMISSQAVSTSLLSLQAGFIPVLSGRENIVLSATLLGLSKKEISENMQAIIDYADLNDHINRSVETYSSGMRARLGFSIAKFSQADFLLLDEMLGVGDQEFKAKSAAEIESIVSSDRTVMLVSHSEDALRGLCDRLVWLEYGRIIDDGEPDRVYENYKEYNKICMAISAKANIPPSKVRENGRFNDPLKVIKEFELIKMQQEI